MTEAQKKIYDKIESGKWYSKYSNGVIFVRNFNSQCHKMFEKRLLLRKLKDNVWYFKKENPKGDCDAR